MGAPRTLFTGLRAKDGEPRDPRWSYLFDSIRLDYQTSFDRVPTYLGQGVALDIDCSLDDEADIAVIVIARDEAELKRFHDHFGLTNDVSRSKMVAITWGTSLKVVEKLSPTSTPKTSVNEEDW